MKKLLLLFIPLVFFFSCEDEENNNDNTITSYNCSLEHGCFQIEGGQYNSLEECEDVCSQCNCGEVVEIDSYPAFAGDYVIDVNDLDEDGDNTDFIVVGAHPGYSFTIFQMYCSGEMMSLCGDVLEVGELFCFDFMSDCYIADCAWGPFTYYDVLEDEFVTVDTYLEQISISDGVFVQSALGPIQNSQTISYDCD